MTVNRFGFGFPPFKTAALPIIEGIGDDNFDFQDGVPSEMFITNQTAPVSFENIANYTRVDDPYTSLDNNEMTGMYNDANLFTPASEVVEVRLHFSWDAVTFEGLELIIVDPAVTHEPTFMGMTITRNVTPRTRSIDGVTPGCSWGLLAGQTNQNLSGSEIIADGTTVHTVGFRSTDTTDLWETFFDGALKDSLTLAAPDIITRDGCRRVGIAWACDQDVNPAIVRLRMLEVSTTNGTLWPVT